MSVTRLTITKSNDGNYNLKIQKKRAGMDYTSMEDFSLTYDSGREYLSGNYYGIENMKSQLSIKAKYSSWNQLRTAQFNVIFEFTIRKLCSWNVIIIN